jgi:Ca-activated chloride channel family protein
MKAYVALLSLLVAIQEPTIRVNVQLQQVVTTVRDQSGAIVRGLQADDFILEDDGVQEKIAHFSNDSEEPISVGILIDNTQSMGTMPGGTISAVTAASGLARMLLQRMKPNDETVVMSFARNFRVEQTFTKDRKKLEESLIRLTNEPRQAGTDIINALPRALGEMRKASLRKRGLIVMTDAYFGGNLSEVAKQVREAEIPIFAFAIRGANPGVQYPPGYACTASCHTFGTLPAPPRGSNGMADLTHPFLDMLTKETGGRAVVFEMHLRDTLLRVDSALAEIAAELRGQYTLGYYPSGDSKAGSQIRVRTRFPTNRVFIRRELTSPPASQGNSQRR